MKIAFLVKSFPVLSQTFILNQITGLIDRGHEITIFSFKEKTTGTVERHSVVDQYGLLAKVRYPPTPPKNRFSRIMKAFYLIWFQLLQGSLVRLSLLNVFKYGRRAYSLKLFYQSLMFLGHDEFDVVHSQFGTVSLDGLIFRRLGLIKGKWITSFRGYDISEFIQSRGDSVYFPLWREGDFFLANCRFFQQRAIQMGCPTDKITAHGSGINCQRFSFSLRSQPQGGPVHIVTIGRLVEKKGIEYGIRAVAKLLQSSVVSSDQPFCTLRYDIIGDGPLRNQLQTLIDNLDVSDCVKLLGQMEQAALIDVLKTAHISLAPSVTAADANQDAPVNTLKEAMAVGIPVISTQHGGIPELVEDGISGILVPERDADALAQAILELINHPERWNDMSRAGRLAVEEKYDMEVLNDELVEIYQQVIGKTSQNNQNESELLQNIPLLNGKRSVEYIH